MLFRKEDIQALFKNKKVVIVGDSVYRCMYKDIVLALQADRMLETDELKKKGEATFLTDSLIYRTELTNGREFTEIREYQSACGFYLVQYYFVTRCYNDRVEAMLADFEKEMPDVIIMNSCQWDVSRYGERGPEDYLKNMNILLTRLHSILKKETIFLWCTALPLASQIVGGFLLDEIKFLSAPLRIFILEANYEVAQLVTSYGFDVLDLHFYMRSSLKHRENDGVHWNNWAHRHITELILTFLCDAWGLPLPQHTIQKLKEADRDGGNLNLPHLSVEGRPNFIDVKIAKLEMLAANAANWTN